MVDMLWNPTKPNHIYLMYMYKQDLALNNLQWLICHKTKWINESIFITYEKQRLFFSLKLVSNKYICHHHHVVPPARISLTLSRHFSYHSSPPAGLQDYILCPHIVAVCKFVLVILLLHIHMWGSIGVHRLWALPCFSSSVPRVWFVLTCNSFRDGGQVSV